MKVRLSVGEQYCKEAERMGLSLSPEEVNTAFRQAYQHYSLKYPNYGISQGLNGQSWWIGVVQNTFSHCRVQDPVLLNTVAQNLYHNFSNAENWEVNGPSHSYTQGIIIIQHWIKEFISKLLSLLNIFKSNFFIMQEDSVYIDKWVCLKRFLCVYSVNVNFNCTMFLCFRYFQTQRKPWRVALL